MALQIFCCLIFFATGASKLSERSRRQCVFCADMWEKVSIIWKASAKRRFPLERWTLQLGLFLSPMNTNDGFYHWSSQIVLELSNAEPEWGIKGKNANVYFSARDNLHVWINGKAVATTVWYQRSFFFHFCNPWYAICTFLHWFAWIIQGKSKINNV